MGIIKSLLTGALMVYVALTQSACSPSQTIPAGPAVNNPAAVQRETKSATKESPIGVEIATEAIDKYILRGSILDKGRVVQPAISAIYGDMNMGDFNVGDVILTGFGNIGLENKESNEGSLFLDIERPIVEFPNGYDIDFLSGYELITAPCTNVDKTQGVYGGLRLEKNNIVGKEKEKVWGAEIKILHDFDEGNGTYGELGLDHETEIGKLPLKIYGKLGFNKEYFREDSGFSHAEAGVESNIEIIKDKMYVVPNVNYLKALGNDFEDTINGGLKIVLIY